MNYLCTVKPATDEMPPVELWSVVSSPDKATAAAEYALQAGKLPEADILVADMDSHNGADWDRHRQYHAYHIKIAFEKQTTNASNN